MTHNFESIQISTPSKWSQILYYLYSAHRSDMAKWSEVCLQNIDFLKFQNEKKNTVCGLPNGNIKIKYSNKAIFTKWPN